MSRFTLSIEEITAAPPQVRLWLEQKTMWAFARIAIPKMEGSASSMAERSQEVEPADSDMTAPQGHVRGASATVEPATKDAAIQKLIAERAYELWENQGRPHGCDLIHWHEAEQEIMDCLKRIAVVAPQPLGSDLG
jgi:Protein of unknown function (DUF2934)